MRRKALVIVGTEADNNRPFTLLFNIFYGFVNKPFDGCCGKREFATNQLLGQVQSELFQRLVKIIFVALGAAQGVGQGNKILSSTTPLLLSFGHGLLITLIKTVGSRLLKHRLINLGRLKICLGVLLCGSVCAVRCLVFRNDVTLQLLRTLFYKRG